MHLTSVCDCHFNAPWKFPHHSSLCLAEVKLSHVPNILKLKRHFLSQNPRLCKELNIPKQSNTHFARNAKGLGHPEQMKSLMDVKKIKNLLLHTENPLLMELPPWDSPSGGGNLPKYYLPSWRRCGNASRRASLDSLNRIPVQNIRALRRLELFLGIRTLPIQPWDSLVKESKEQRREEEEDEINFNCGHPWRQFWPNTKDAPILPIPPGQEVCHREDLWLRGIPLNQEELLASTSIDFFRWF